MNIFWNFYFIFLTKLNIVMSTRIHKYTTVNNKQKIYVLWVDIIIDRWCFLLCCWVFLCLQMTWCWWCMHKYHSEQLATVFILFFDKIISMALDFYCFNPYSYPQHQYVTIEVCGVDLLWIIWGLSWQKFDFVFEDVNFWLQCVSYT